jgi:hypothetical protein
VSLRGVVKSIANQVPLAATVADYIRFRVAHPRLMHLSRYRRGDAALVREIREKGYVIVENYMSKDRCTRCIDDLESLFASSVHHVHKHSDVRIYGAEDLSENIRAFADDLFLARMSNHYNAVKTVNAFTLGNKIEPSESGKGSGEGWHKDYSFLGFKAILYLNDVGEHNGAFQVFERSHTVGQYLRDMRAGDLKFRHLRISDAQLERILARDPSRLRTLTGKAGTLIMVETASIHRGRPPTEGVRYALTNYYVERWQISEPTIDAAKPVSPAKVRRMRDEWTNAAP